MITNVLPTFYGSQCSSGSNRSAFSAVSWSSSKQCRLSLLLSVAS